VSALHRKPATRKQAPALTELVKAAAVAGILDGGRPIAEAIVKSPAFMP
jgi:hypothetical protein